MLTHSRLKSHLFILFWICVLRSVFAAPVPVSNFNSLSSSILTGDTLSFKIDFRNAGDVLGYGPYVDVVVPFDTINNRQTVTINSAAFLDMTISPMIFKGVSSFIHPYAQDAAGTKISVSLAANEVFYTYRLPFLSFAATQPTISLDVFAFTDKNSTSSSVLLKTRSGFTYGDKPVDTNPSIIGAWANSTTAFGDFKTQITFSSKDFMIGPQYIYNCTHMVNFRTALQTLNGTLIIYIPCGIRLDKIESATVGNLTISTGSFNVSQNYKDSITLRLNNSLASLDNVYITFSFYIDYNDTLKCGYGSNAWSPYIYPWSFNLTYNWFDPSCNCSRQYLPGQSGSITAVPLKLNSAISRSVDVNAVGNTPGDTFLKTIDFLISDPNYCFDQLNLYEALNDGLMVNITNFQISVFASNINATLIDDSMIWGTVNNTLQSSLNVSKLVHPNTRLRGPVSLQFKYNGKVQDKYLDGTSIVHGTKLDSTSVLNLFQYSCNFSDTSVGFNGTVSSASSIKMINGIIDLTTYAIDGAILGTQTLTLYPTQVVTLRVTYATPTTDFNSLNFELYPPHPVFVVPALMGKSASGIPAVNSCGLGPLHTLPITPNVTTSTVQNNIYFDFGSNADPTNTQTMVDIMCTLQITDSKFPNDLQIATLSKSTEDQVGIQVDWLAYKLAMPSVTIAKKIVAVSNAVAVLNTTPSKTFTAPGTAGKRWATGNFTSSDTLTLPTSVTGADAGDLITIALVLENTGGSQAFNVLVNDTIGSDYALPTNRNLAVYNGLGQSLAFTGDLFTTGLSITPTIPAAGIVGANIIVITYDVQLKNTVQDFTSYSSGVASLLRYASVNGGTDFAIPDISTDFVSVTTPNPSVVGVLDYSSLALTQKALTTANVDDLAPGEYFRVLYTITFPEGVTPASTFTINLPTATGTKMRAINSTVTLGSSITTASSTVAISDTNADSINDRVIVTFGDVTNNFDNVQTAGDNILIYVTGIVTNTDVRTPSVILKGTLNYHTNRQQVVNFLADIVEPANTLTITGTPTSVDGGDTLTFTITITPTAVTNSPSYGMTITNFLPTDYSLIGGQTTVTGIAANKFTLTSGNVTAQTSIALSVPVYDVTESPIVIVYKVLLSNTIAPNTQITNAVSGIYYSADEVATAKSYSLAGNVKITTATPTVSVTLPFTSLTETVKTQYATTVDDLALGEDLNFLAKYQFTEGTTANTQLKFQVNQTDGSYLEMFGCTITFIGSSLSYPTPMNATATVSAGVCTFNIGTVINSPDNVANNSDAILVLINSRVAHNRNNVGSATLKGSIATITATTTTKSTTFNIEFVEPTLALTKTTSNSSPVDADDSIVVTLTLTNLAASSKAPAYVIAINDTIPSMVTLQGNPTVVGTGWTSAVVNGVITLSANTFTLGSTMTATYTVKVASNIQTGTSFVLPGATGTYLSNKVTTAAKSYSLVGSSATVQVLAPSFNFSVVSTSNPSTGSQFFNPSYVDLAICESITLQVTLMFPEGRTITPQIVVTMPVPFLQIQNAVIQSLGTSLTPSGGVNIAYSDSNNDVVSDRLTVTFGNITNAPNNIVNANDNIVIYLTGIVLSSASETGNALANTAVLTYNAVSTSSLNLFVEIVEPRLAITLNIWNLYDYTTADDEISDGQGTNEGFLMPTVNASVAARGFDNGDKVKFLATIAHTATSKASAYNLAITTLSSSLLRFFNNSVFTNASSVITYTPDGFSVAVPSLELTGGTFSLRYTKYIWNYSANVTLTETMRVQYGQCSNSSMGNTLSTNNTITVPRQNPEVTLQLVSSIGSTTPINAPQMLTIGNQTTVLVRIKIPEMLVGNLQMEFTLAKGLSIVALPTISATGAQIAYLTSPVNVSTQGDTFKVNFTNVINTDTRNDVPDYIDIYTPVIVLDLPSVGSGAERAATTVVAWADGNDAKSLTVARVIEPALVVSRDVNALVASPGQNITAAVKVKYSNAESLAYDVTISNPIVNSFTLDLNSVNITGNPTNVSITPQGITAYYSVLTDNAVTITFKALVSADVNTPLISVGQVTATYSTMPGDLRSVPMSPFNASSVERLYIASPTNTIGVLYRVPGEDIGVMSCWNQSQVRTNDQYIRTHPGGCAFGLMQWDSNCIQESFGYLSDVSLQLYVRQLVLPYGQPTCLRVFRDNLYNTAWDEKTASYSTLSGLTANVLLGRIDITTNLKDEFIEIPLSLQDLSMSTQAIENLVIRQCPYVGTVPSTTNITHLTLIDSKEGEHPPQMILRYASTCTPNTCVHGKCVVRSSVDGPKDFCACASGWMGNSCNIKIDNSCNNRFNSVQLLATDNIPVLDPTSGFSCSAMELRIRGPLVYNRTHTVIYWMNNRGGNAMCDYPGFFWNKDFTNNCEDLWTSSLPWSIGNRCGFTIIDDPDWYIYETFLTVEHNDFMGDFRGYVLNRITRHVFRMQVRFPKRTTVSTTIQVYSSVNLLAAVTFQAYQVTVQNGVIELTTSLQWPFMLDLPVVTSTPLPLTATVSEVLNGRNCGTVNGTACTQKYKFVIAPNTACKLDGLYNVNFTVVCNPALKGDCPLDATTNKAQIAMNIVSEDICSQVSLDVGLTAYMEPYQDEALTIKKNVFLPGQRVYFLANVTVTDNAAELSTTNFTDFSFGPYTLVTAGALTARGSSTLTRFERRGTNWVSLSFVVPSDLNIPVDGVAPFAAQGTLSVRYKYVNTDTAPTTTTTKRFTKQDEPTNDYDQALQIEASVNLQRQDTGAATPVAPPVVTPNDNIKTSSAITFGWSWALFLIAAMYIM